MAGISREQIKKDEASVALVLVVFNIALICVLLIASLYQSFK
jgi:hypothetical protein